MTLKAAVRELVPPILWRPASRLAHLRSRKAPAWEYVPEGWTRPVGPGWNASGVADAYRRKLPALRDAARGPGPLAFSTEALLPVEESVGEQNCNLAFAYALNSARQNTGRLSILDWGGGLGFGRFVAQACLPGLEIDYHVRDLPLIVEGASELVPEVTFWSDDTCLARSYDLVLASGSIQYVQDWRGQLGALVRAATRRVYLTRLPIVLASPSFVVLQRAYGTQYLGWVLNRDELLEAAHAEGLELEREFLIGHRPEIRGAPEQDESRGFLFRR